MQFILIVDRVLLVNHNQSQGEAFFLEQHALLVRWASSTRPTPLPYDRPVCPSYPSQVWLMLSTEDTHCVIFSVLFSWCLVCHIVAEQGNRCSATTTTAPFLPLLVDTTTDSTAPLTRHRHHRCTVFDVVGVFFLHYFQSRDAVVNLDTDAFSVMPLKMQTQKGNVGMERHTPTYKDSQKNKYCGIFLSPSFRLLR